MTDDTTHQTTKHEREIARILEAVLRAALLHGNHGKSGYMQTMNNDGTITLTQISLYEAAEQSGTGSMSDVAREEGGASEPADVRLALEQVAMDRSLTDAERRLAARALAEIRRLAP